MTAQDPSTCETPQHTRPTIPIANLYVLWAYAHQYCPFEAALPHDAESFDRPHDVLAYLLIEHLKKTAPPRHSPHLPQHRGGNPRGAWAHSSHRHASLKQHAVRAFGV